MIEVEGPDGVVHEFPEGTTDDVISKAMRQHYSEPEAAAPRRPLSDLTLSEAGDILGSAVTQAGQQTLRRVDDIARAVASGATGGFADEIAARLNELTGLGSTYEENVAAERARDVETPLPARIAGEVVGSLAPASVIGRGAQAAGLASRIPSFLQAPAAGAGYGAFYGAGTSTEGQRLPGAAAGGLLGGTIGAAIPAVSATGGAIRRGLQRRTDPEATAARMVGEAMRDAGPMGKVGVRLQSLGPRATLADVGGENVRGLARAAVGTPGPGRTLGTQTLQTRARGEGSRLTGSVQENLARGNFYDEMERGLQTLRNNAQARYREAYSAGQNLSSDTLEELLKRDASQQAMREASRLARIQGREIATKVSPAGIATETVDDLKRGLDAMIERQTNPLTGRLNRRGAALNQLKNEILDEVDRLNPAYREARRVYAGDAETLQAFEQGRKAVNRAPEVIRRELADMSQASQEAYRLGAARALQDTIARTPDTASAARKLYGNQLARSRLRSLFPDNESYRRMARDLLGESVFNQTRNFVLAGSQTAPRLAEQQQIAGPILDVATGGTGTQAAAGLLSEMVRRITAPNPRLGQEIANRVFAQGPAAHAAFRESALAAQQRAAQQQIGLGLQRGLGYSAGYGAGQVGGALLGRGGRR